MSVIPAPLPNASASRRGAMSSADKEKLDLYPADPSSLGGGVDTLAPVGSAPNANGATIAGDTLTLQPADETHPGAITPAAQTIGGAKTFAALLTAAVGIVTNLVRAVGVTLMLRSSLGAGAADVAVRIGTSETDGGTNANASLAEIGTGLGGTFVRYAWFTKGGNFYANYLRLPADNSGGLFLGACWVKGSTATGDISLDYGGSGVRMTLGSASGLIRQYGTDSTGSPGNATINRPIGKSAIAVGASSCVITNSHATAAMHCLITPHARDATCKELIAVCGAGTITVSGTANATAALPFSWELKGML